MNPIDNDARIQDRPPEWVVCDYDQGDYSGAQPHFRRPSCVNPRPARLTEEET